MTNKCCCCIDIRRPANNEGVLLTHRRMRPRSCCAAELVSAIIACHNAGPAALAQGGCPVNSRKSSSPTTTR